MDTGVAGIYDYLDSAGTSKQAAQVHVQMGNHQCITVSAGGPGLRSWPAFPPYSFFEVILDHEPSRFWTRYTDSTRMIYANVPKLLVTHHIIRHGGIQETITEPCNARSCSTMKMVIEVSTEQEGLIQAFVDQMQNAHVMSSHAVW